ncbi:DUF6304 family protein [Kordia sp.]|uniref:DUF6304 family protein n=1 Tax=Kordia sp. TaxID=1965332 RepID=UPI0025C3D2A5|nr:DUF6304 family protein [Kordia sp.]MCH2196513.1 DUF6304 family protein [Kordia sp.]
MKYNTIYEDTFGTIKGSIENNFSEDFDLSKNYTIELNLEGILFNGATFDGLELQNEDYYTKEQLHRYSFYNYEVFGTKQIIKELTNCKFQFILQLKIVDKKSFQIHKVNGNLTVLLGNFSPEEYSVFQYDYSLNEIDHSIMGDSFENLFDKLKEKIKETHFIKNCYGCNYSDYSPYGSDHFGDMLCFKNSKDKYLKIKNKESYFRLLGNQNPIYVQETHLCDEFEFRKENIGYRG